MSEPMSNSGGAAMTPGHESTPASASGMAPAMVREPPPETAAPAHPTRFAALWLGAVGVVFGDIGTSPLYALKECINPEHGFARNSEDILGILSLIVWSLTMVVTLKYVTCVLRADNRGEGGIFAMLALLPRSERGPFDTRIGWVALLVIVGAGLLYGDGVITPAISVLSAVEGLEVATSAFRPAVLPITCAILVALFVIQRYGTAAVGKLFGPVMVIWFVTIGGLGAWHIAQDPSVLRALSPGHAVAFFEHHGWHGTRILGAVVLTFTGGEALYADMGHFGLRPIRAAWLWLAMPALVLCYFGQGALLLSHSLVDHPFFALVPRGPWTIALVVLSALATVIASQALISGAFSLTHQAVQLGYLPRVTIKHTSRRTEGQIYIPEVNWALAVCSLGLVLAFGASSKLAAAYGIAVTGTMVITSIVYFMVLRESWGWSLAKALPLLLLFLAFDVPFLGANLLKFLDGGYVPVIVAAWLVATMTIWKKGHALVAEYGALCPSIDAFWPTLEENVPVRVPGTGAFLVEHAGNVPAILLHHVKRVRALHETVILLTVVTEHSPLVSPSRRWRVDPLGRGFYRLIARYGFMEEPDVGALLQRVAAAGAIPMQAEDVTYYLGRITYLGTDRGKMGRVAERFFAFLERNSRSMDGYFSIPAAQVVEFGTRLDL